MLTQQTSMSSIPTARSITLPNGLKSIFYSGGNNPIVCLQIHIRVGSVYENDDSGGYAHFLEHLSFKATNSFPDNDLSDMVPALGASINAYTDFDSTCYYLNLPSEQLKQGLALLAELTRYPLIREHDVRAEKDIILEEIKQYANEPETDFSDYIQQHYFSLNPLRRAVLGTPGSVRAASADKLRTFYKQHYHPRNAFIVACGQFDEDNFKTLLNEHFGSWQSPGDWAPEDFSRFLEPIDKRSGTFHRVKHSDSEYIALVLPELSELHPFSESFLIAMRYFAIGKSSLLHKRLVETDKLCSSVRVSSLSSNLSGISVIMLNPVSNASRERISQSVREEYHKAVHMLISADDFELIKRDIIHSWAFDFESMENLAGSLASEEMLGDYNKLYAYPRLLEVLTRDRVASEILKFWDPGQICCYYQSRRKSPALEQLNPLPIPTRKPVITQNPESIFRDMDSTVRLSAAKPVKPSNTACHQFTLSNGLRLIFKPEPGRPVTGFALSTDVSQLMESETERGHNFFTSAAMLYGTERRDHNEIMRFSRYHGFNIRVIHHLDATTFRGKCFQSSLAPALELLAEIISRPRFDTRHLHMLKEMSIDSIRRERDYPVSHGFNRWFSLLTGNQSNLGPATGLIKDIRKTRADDLLRWHQLLCDPGRYALCVVGDYDPNQILDLTEHCFGSLVLSSKSVAPARAVFKSAERQHKLENRQSGQAIIHLGSYGVKADDIIENTAFHLLSQVLGGDLGSRFYRELRENRGYAYQTGFDFTSINQLGFWYAYAFCDPSDHREALSLMRSLIADVCKHGITAEELENTKQYLTGMNRFEHESVSWMAAQIANLVALGYQPDHYLERETRIKSVDLDTVASVAAQWLQPSLQVSHILL